MEEEEEEEEVEEEWLGDAGKWGELEELGEWKIVPTLDDGPPLASVLDDDGKKPLYLGSADSNILLALSQLAHQARRIPRQPPPRADYSVDSRQSFPQIVWLIFCF